MEDIYIVMLVALFALAITDLVVGVSNDAVNFLNSAIGSKAVSMRTIMIIASIGVAVGAIFSSGLMEVARKGIFMPGQFYFEEIMIIFMAVMITDVLLLDFFNSLGLPTSTTVSIVFELLGAAVCMAVIKIYTQDNGDLGLLQNYINSSKATEIILGILLAVVIAFIVGAFVQYISRLIFSFQFEKKVKYVGAAFGGFSLTAILYFIVIKGLKSVSFIAPETLAFINENTWLIVLIGFIIFTLISQFLMSILKLNILRIIIIIGTFALALAFAGNDLVNFIGVPIAAWQSFDLWQSAYNATGAMPSEFLMTGLSGKVNTPELLLVCAGAVMVITLWFSSKAKTVVDTGINLSRQGDSVERFEPNWLSRGIVRYSVMIGGGVSAILPSELKNKIENKFSKPASHLRSRRVDAPAFDMVRASVNLVVASVLISIGTNMKLPLSTTYVTFMVAMGTSLADRAWDRESAVYRVAGVLNVIGGWFVTAIVAFTAAAIFASIIFYGGTIALVVLIIAALVVVVRSSILHSRETKKENEKKKFNKSDIITINEITAETSENISRVIGGIDKVYSKSVDHLGYYDLGKLKKNYKRIEKLEVEVDELKDNIFYFIKSLDENSIEASKFYILTLDYLQDMVQSISFIARNSYNHVHNNHKNLKFNQIRDLKKVDDRLQVLFDELMVTFNHNEFDKIDALLDEKQELLDYVSDLIQKQIERIRTSESSPRNTKLYFGILLETKDLIGSTMNLLQLFQEFYQEARKTSY
ncbi:inorganic phosphate transporter [Christiangramia portivictoriae]|uniref:inorganic phosphate transporter n=1 Tax=Christiangramia portivictoriae TaxID=326069 RepID=UPI000427FBDE|nr:inorganic phosphate transporter [Christiangramia portivictoriae]